MRHPSRIPLAALALALALAAAGCGSNSEPGPAQAKPAAPLKKVATPVDNLSPNLVGAVTTAKGGASLVQVKYELSARPGVGDDPVDVDVVIVPAADNIDRVSGTIQGDDGLEVVSGESISPVEKLVFGTPIHHTVKVRAKRDGIFTLSVALSVQSGGEAFGPAYSLPIIAGKGLVDAGGTPAPGRGGNKPAPRPTAQ